jgi:hypothetical protein
MARSYDIELLPQLLEQTQFFRAQCDELVGFCQTEYGAFLTFIDKAGESADNDADREVYEYIYGFAEARLEALQSMMNDESESARDLEAALLHIQKTGNTEVWNDLANEMISDGEYREKTEDFKAWVLEEMESLRSSVNELLGDWKSAIAEGDSAQLAQFMEALQSIEEEGFEDEDDSYDGQCGDECDDDDDCCDQDDGCCGRQTPCCREDDDEA